MKCISLEVIALNCQICGAHNPQSAKNCFSCGSELEQPSQPAAKLRVSLGDYEVADYDNDPGDRWLQDIDPDEPILDRDIQVWPQKLKPRAVGGVFVNGMLIGLLFLIVTLSYFGINALGKIRQDRQTDLIRQVEVQEEEALKAQRAEYLKKYREFIILAQAQAQDFDINRQELARIETSRWLKNIFLDGIFSGMIDRFIGTKAYTAMIDRSAKLGDLIRSLNDPPAEFISLHQKIQMVHKTGQAITEVFTGELDETATDSIKGLLVDYETYLTEASNDL